MWLPQVLWIKKDPATSLEYTRAKIQFRIHSDTEKVSCFEQWKHWGKMACINPNLLSLSSPGFCLTGELTPSTRTKPKQNSKAVIVSSLFSVFFLFSYIPASHALWIPQATFSLIQSLYTATHHFPTAQPLVLMCSLSNSHLNDSKWVFQ